MNRDFTKLTQEQLIEELETLTLQVNALSLEDTIVTKDLMTINRLIEMQQLTKDLCTVMLTTGHTDTDLIITINLTAQTTIAQLSNMLRRTS